MLTNHKTWCFGYAKILLEAGVAEKGCLKNILSRKAFAKAIFNLKATAEALDRLLINVTVEQTNIEMHPQDLLDVIQVCNTNNVDAVYKDESTNLLIQKYVGYQEKFTKDLLERLLDFGSRSWVIQNWPLC